MKLQFLKQPGHFLLALACAMAALTAPLPARKRCRWR